MFTLCTDVIRRRLAGFNRCALLAALSVVSFTSAPAWTAEIQLRSECRARGPVVTLSDLADLSAADPQAAASLGAVELFPSPTAGRQRFVRVREIQDLLLLRGVNLAEHRFSGASQVAVLSTVEPARAAEPRPLMPAQARKAERQAGEAIVRYLQERVSNKEQWTVNAPLDATAARAVANAGARIAVRGGADPWVGSQRFELTVDTPDGPQAFPVDAQVSVPSATVAAARSLPRGAVIRAEDVRIQKAAPGENPSEGFHSPSEVIGQETTRAVAEGKALDRDSLRPPLAIRRGEVVTVYARNSGIRVRTTARAREDGSVGDLITIESLLDRKPYTVRVCGIQEAEVFGRATQADGATAAGPVRVGNEMPIHPQGSNWR